MKITLPVDFAPAYKGKLFTVKAAKMEPFIEIPVAEDSEEGKLLKSMIEKGWQPELDKFISEKQKLYGDALNDTEANVMNRVTSKKAEIRDEKAVKKWLEEELKGAQVMIVNAMKTFESLVSGMANKFYAKVADLIDKKIKSKLKDMKIKAGLKILVQVGIIVAAAAVAIVASAASLGATVATAGVAGVTFIAVAPVVAAAVMTIAKSGYSIYQTIDKAWPNHKKMAQALQSALKDLQDAQAYEDKKALKIAKGALGPKEKLKLFFGNTKGKRDAVVKAADAVASYQYLLKTESMKLKTEVAKVTQSIDSLEKNNPPPDVKKKLAALKASKDKMDIKLDSLDKYYDAYDKLIAEAKGVVSKPETFDAKKLGTILGKLQDFMNNDIVQQVRSQAPDVLDGLKDIGDSLYKIATAPIAR